jgi:hypothetical protein
LIAKENPENDSPIESSLNPDITVSIDTEEADIDQDSADYEADPSQADTIDPDIINSSTQGINVGPTVSHSSESDASEPNDEVDADEDLDAEEIDPDKINIGTSNPNVGF